MIESPLNYMGGKYKLLPQIIKFFPRNINIFLDLFCGGCNVGINIKSNKKIFNDNNKLLIEMFKVFKKNNIKYTINSIDNLIQKYNLSNVSRYGYKYYNCNSSEGLSKYNKGGYLKLRHDFNKFEKKNSLYYYMFYCLVVFAFNNQIRFNSKSEFNSPVGKRDFNQKMKNKLIKFIDSLKNNNTLFTASDFRKINFENLKENDFIYVDPPYLITCASYNENNQWSEKDEIDLLKLLKKLSEKKIKFALSNVLENKGKSNEILKKWILENKNLSVFHLENNYSNSNYQAEKKFQTDEVLIINYSLKRSFND